MDREQRAQRAEQRLVARQHGHHERLGEQRTKPRRVGGVLVVGEQGERVLAQGYLDLGLVQGTLDEVLENGAYPWDVI